jgi:hypothetical protein
MPFKPLKFRPGVNRDTTNYSGEGGWWEMDKVRFLSGFPQKIGGWIKATPFTFFGTCRFMWNWITSFGDNFLAIGTNLKLYLEAGGNFYDITPIEGTSGTGDITFTATNGSSSVTVVDVTAAPAYSPTAGNYVTFSGAVSLGGNVTASILNATHEIATVTNSTTYSIVVSVVANASDSGNGGASVVGEYDIASGNVGDEFGYGWGTGTWSRNAWGLGSEAPIVLAPRTWWYDNFDNDLVANIEGGSIYYWERGSSSNPSTALDTRAELMEDVSGATDVPVKVTQVLVSQQDKHLLACGAVPYGSSSASDFDPLLIRWTNQDDPLNWTPSPTNSAGFIKVSRGSRIVRAIPTRQEVLIFTDSHLYTLQFTGTTDVFSLQEYAENISIAGARAVISANNVTFWMGQDKFYAYTGRVETLPTTLRQHVFSDINLNAGYQIIAGTNEGWQEVWWIYPSSTSNYPNKYVIFNYNEKIWYYGNIDRTGWIDSPLRDSPMAVNTPLGSNIGQLYFQENGVNDDLLPMDSYILSNDFDIEDGERFMLTKRIVPDINFTGSTASEPEVQIQIRPTNFPGSPSGNNPQDERPVIQTTVGNYTDQVFIRARARQMGFRVGSTDLGVQWQLGTPRLEARQDGKR